MSLNPFVAYKKVNVGTIPKAKLERALKGLAVRLTNAELSGDRVMIVHPLNAKSIKQAKSKNKGLTTHFTPHEALADLDYHEHAGEGMDGGSLWSWLKEKAYPWLKKNWNVIKPVLSTVADTVASSYPASAPYRGALKQLTGIGNKSHLVKGSDAAKEHMKKLREKRKGGMSGSSFRMP